MAVKAASQVTLIDLTDAYSVNLELDSHIFSGSTTGVSGTQTITTKVVAMRGAEQVPCKIGTMTTPTGISGVSDGKSPAPTITITATSALTTAGTFTIPVEIDGGIVINKIFSYAIALKGATGATGAAGSAWYSGTGITGTSTTETVFSNSGVSSAKVNDMYLNTSNGNVYKCTLAGAATVAKWVYAGNIRGVTGGTGAQGSGWYCGTGITGTSTTAAVFSGSGVASAKVNDMYLNTSTGNTYKCTVAGNASTAKWVYAGSIKGATGATGKPGEDAVTLSVESSAGIIFKNTAIATTLTAHVYKAGQEVTGDALTALGTINWYKDGGATAVATGQTLTLSAGDITNRATYEAKLEK